MDFLYLIFYGCLRLRFLDVETNPGRRRPVPVICRTLFSNVQGLAANLSNLTVASSQYIILLCSETLVSDMHYVLKMLVPGFGARRVVSGQDASGPWDGCIRSRWLRSISPTQIRVWLLRNAGF